MKRWLEKIVGFPDRFLFESCNPTAVPVLRIGYGVLVTICCLIWIQDASVWFTNTGVMQVDTAKSIVGKYEWSVLYYLPSTNAVVYACLSVMLVQCVLLTVGFWSRFQAASIFIWLVSFQNRNFLICDAEDTLFRMLAFFLIFLPLDDMWSLRRWFSGGQKFSVDRSRCWGLRLIQLQMSLLYASAALCKMVGSSWRDGSALYTVSRLTDLYGRFWVPEILFETPWIIKATTWSVLAIEALLPIALWIPATRKPALVFGILLHLSIEYSMNLFLFQWLMIVGLLAFLPERRGKKKGSAEDTISMASSPA